MKVYVVEFTDPGHGENAPTYLVSVFSSLGKATAAADEYCTIKEVTLDELPMETRQQEQNTTQPLDLTSDSLGTLNVFNNLIK